MISARIINPQSSVINRSRGVALLMVLLIVMAVTIIAAGFIARTDVELASGESMLVRVQMDQLANSGLEHAKGLLLRPGMASPVDTTDWYWLGSDRISLLYDSHDYYDVLVRRDDSDPDDYCTYDVDCVAYRERGGERIGQTPLKAKLRLDPCIGLWTKTNTSVTFRQNWILHGDMRANGSVVNQAGKNAMDGDVFCASLEPVGESVGQKHDYNDEAVLSLAWPPVTSAYAKPPTSTFTLGSETVSSGTTYSSTYIYKRTGNLVLEDNISIQQGMLLVKTGNLTVAGSGCSITNARNLPALYVEGNLVLRDADNLTVQGLTVVDGNLLVHSGAHGVKFLGGLCVAGEILETTPDASGNGNYGILRKGPQWATDDSRNVLQFDGTDDYVEIPHNASLCVTTGVTVMAWIKAPRYAFPGQLYQGILAKGNNPRSYSLYTTSSGNLQFSTGSDPTTSVSTGTIPLDAWVHVCAMVRDGAHRYFINGVPAGNEGSGITLPGESDTAPVLLGKAPEDSREFAGLMEDVRIYNRGLADEEVATVASGGHAIGLVGHWQLDGPGSEVTIVADPIKAAIVAGSGSSAKQWSPAAGAFFRRIERQ